MLQPREWVVVILAAVVATAIAVTVGYLFDLSWLTSSAWLVGIAVAGLVIYTVRRSDRS